MSVAGPPSPPEAALRLCASDELAVGKARVCNLGRDREGRPLRALLLLDPLRQLYAYVDRCRHLPIPLDNAGKYLDDDGTHLICRTHGARYRLVDGMCIDGPCRGLGLWPLPVVFEGDQIVLRRDALEGLLQLLD